MPPTKARLVIRPVCDIEAPSVTRMNQTSPRPSLVGRTYVHFFIAAIFCGLTRGLLPDRRPDGLL